MKVDNATNTVVERDGLASNGAFSIQFNAKMAKILSDGLYSDKIQSVIRELSCNAVDSHVESGQADRPIEVHLPTTWEPWFHVRDFGVGLDHDQVIGIYTVYGASTKTNSNEFIGQLGLGSKSPFSYVDAFDVTARKNGVERQYSMYKDEDSMPSVALLGEFATTEPNGVTVKMPVKQEDIRWFSEKAALVFSWFDVKPSITGVSGLNIPQHNTAYEGNGWKIRRRNPNGYSSDPVNRPVAIMGRVAYPLDSNSIADLTVAQKTMLEIPSMLIFNIGDLEVAASREGLGYDKRTQENIRKKLDTMLSDLSAEFEKKIAAASTEWAARQLFGEIFGNEGGFRYEFEKAFSNKGLMWRGKLIKEAHVTLKTVDLWDGTASSPQIWRSYGSYKTVRKMSYHEPLTIRCSENTMVVFDDLERGTQGRVNYLHEQHDRRKEIILIGASPLKTVNDILAMLGNPAHQMASELPKRPSAGRGERVNMLAYRGDSYRASRSWEPADVELDDGGVYVMMDRYTVKDGDNEVNDLASILGQALELGIIATDDIIYSPRANMRKKVAEHGDWINLFDLLREELSARLTPEVLQVVADMNEYQTAVRAARDNSLWQFQLRIRDKDGVFARFVNAMRELEDMSKKNASLHTLVALAQQFGNKVDLPTASVDASGLYSMVMASYPMFNMAFNQWSNRNINSNNARPYEDYINMCDEYSKMKMENAVGQLVAA